MSTQNNSVAPTAVLLMAYGTPVTIRDVGAYFTHIRGGVRPPEEVIARLVDRYRQVGGKTPLYEITLAQASALQKLLDARYGAGAYVVYVGMKHWHPFIKDVLTHIAHAGSTEVIAIALAPHYSKISIGGYQKALDEANGDTNLTIRLVESWHTNSKLIACIAEQAAAALARCKGASVPHIVFTAHSLPERIRTWNDPYEAQLLETAGLVAEVLGHDDWSFSFQSAGKTGEPWIGPDIKENLVVLRDKGKKNILICPIGFVSDNLEIVFDIDIDARERAQELGIALSRTQSRNTHALFIEALAEVALGVWK